MTVEYRVLGPLEVLEDGTPVPVPAGRARVLLATLLLRANRFVSVDELIDRLWDGAQPNSARAKAALHMVVNRLRQALGDANCVHTATNGYVAEVADDQLDLARFRRLTGSGDLAGALRLWRGPVLANVSSDALHREDVPPLLEERLVALERRIDADLDRGLAGELVPELSQLTQRHPLREMFWSQLMRALSGAGRQADAFAAYRRVSSLLAEELGVDPGPQLRTVYQDLLVGAVPTVLPQRYVPRQLPLEIPGFVGRKAELGALSRATSPILVVHGTGGVGKTALALHWAHAVRDEFPDGQLYVDLNGFSPESEPLLPEVAAEALLVGLGTHASDVPLGLEQRSAALRTAIADRRMLIFLDNAASSAQVAPLLPGSARTTVLVTSRNQLRGLAAQHGAVRVGVDQLDRDAAASLLVAVLGHERQRAEPDAVDEVIERCAGLPLALRVFAERVARFPDVTLRLFADELADETTRLDSLTADEGESTDVRTVLSWSYRALDDTSARLFRLLGVHPGADFGVPAAAALLGATAPTARRHLERLAADNLIQSRVPGRYEFHDLLHAYAAELVADDPERDDAVRRITDWYSLTLRNATRVFRVTPDQWAGCVLQTDVAPLEFQDVPSATTWCFVEWMNVAALVHVVADRSWYRDVWRLVDDLFAAKVQRRSNAHLVDLSGMAVHAVRRLGSDASIAIALGHLGWAYEEVGRLDEAIAVCEEALLLARGANDPAVEAVLLLKQCNAYWAAGRDNDALASEQEMLCVATEIGDRKLEAAALSNAASSLLNLKRYADAKEYAKRAARLLIELGDPLHHCTALLNLAAARYWLREDHEAEATCLEGIELSRRYGQLASLGGFHDILARTLAARGDIEEAKVHWRLGVQLGHGFDERRLREVRELLRCAEAAGDDPFDPRPGS